MQFDKISTISYKDWSPGLGNGEATLGEVLASLPANNPEDISKIVKIFENPKSPIAFKGAVNLQRHDAIHALLGRGLLAQDEAFVIGFTMGTSKDITAFEEFFFKKISMYIYPKTYRFSRQHLKAYDLGVAYGKKCKTKRVYEFAFEDKMNVKMKDIRAELGIEISELKAVYQKEREAMPDTKSSNRLDV